MEARALAFALARIGFAALGIVALTYQYTAISDRPGFEPVNFFSFFTIQSNILAVAVLAISAVVRREERTVLVDAVRSAVTLYIAITGVVFALLLSGLQESVNTPAAWVDTVVHQLIPIVLVADWLLDPPRRPIPLRFAAVWLSYPVAWFVYTLARGPSADWYPYPFVDVASHGYARVLVNAAVLLVGIAVAATLVAVVGNRRALPRGAEATAQ